MRLTSTAFQLDQPIPSLDAGDGDDVSPSLEWSGQGTREFVLICDDPDAPIGDPRVRCVIYKTPAGTHEFAEHIPPESRLQSPRGALQGRNSWSSGRTIGYRGTAPPPGRLHDYRFRGRPPKAIFAPRGILIGTYRR